MNSPTIVNYIDSDGRVQATDVGIDVGKQEWYGALFTNKMTPEQFADRLVEWAERIRSRLPCTTGEQGRCGNEIGSEEAQGLEADNKLPIPPDYWGIIERARNPDPEKEIGIAYLCAKVLPEFSDTQFVKFVKDNERENPWITNLLVWVEAVKKETGLRLVLKLSAES